MDQRFVSTLACPTCGSGFSLDQGDEALVCERGHRFPVVRNVPRFVASDGYASNFGFEWNVHNKTQLDTASRHESEEQFAEKTGLSPSDVRGKLVLDVGCGMGRFSDVVSRWGGTVVGIDLTSAVDAAYGNIGARDNVNLVQADVFHLPFRPETFDIIFSIGVLHHTPDTRAAFDRLPDLLKPGGTIAIWVYSTSMLASVRRSEQYRRVTTRLPKRLLYALCHVAIPWYYLDQARGIRWATRMLLPVSNHPNPEWRVLDTFDWYSPRYQWKHGEDEVRGWFEARGLVSVETLPFPTSVRGVRPPRSPSEARAGQVPAGQGAR